MATHAYIISIGDEILYGQTLDTNAHWISTQLNLAGIEVARRITVGDTKEAILAAFSEAEALADIILVTGGLGPTSDDLTKLCLLKYFDTHLVRDQQVLDHIKNLFTSRGREVTDVNKAQADIPVGGEAIANVLGTAPGIWIERKEKAFVSMPGVPYEMERMMTDTILPKLKGKYVKRGIYHRLIRTIGIPESTLSDIISDWEKRLPREIKLAYLPTKGSVKLRLTAKGQDGVSLKKKLQQEIDKVLPLIDKYVYGFDEEEIEQVIGKMLKKRGLKLAVAESCTGGYLSHKITSVPGSSGWYQGGIIPYSNTLKNEQLQVPVEVLEEHGAVSESVVLTLAKNVRKVLNADVGIAVSGIAGPGGGTREKPVGLVWIGYSDKRHTTAEKFQFIQERALNIQYTTTAALNMIRVNLERE